MNALIPNLITVTAYFENSAKQAGKILQAFSGVFMGAGVLILAYGMYETILSFSPDTNTSQKVKALSIALAGIMLISFPTIINYILNGTGVTVSYGSW